MKVNFFYLCIGTLIALLLAYWVFNVAEGDENDKISGICSAVCFLGTLIPLFSIDHKAPRIGVNLRVLSAVFFFLKIIRAYRLAFIFKICQNIVQMHISKDLYIIMI